MSLLNVTSSPVLSGLLGNDWGKRGNISLISIAPNNTYVYNQTDTCIATSVCGRIRAFRFHLLQQEMYGKLSYKRFLATAKTFIQHAQILPAIAVVLTG